MPVSIVQKLGSKVVFAGSLRSRKLYDVFTEVSVASYTGILRLTTQKNEYRFYFQSGHIIYADKRADQVENMVLDIIKHSGFLSRETLMRCEKQKSRSLKTMLEILIDNGYVSMLLYSKVISTAIRINMIKALLETDGDYVFELRNKIESVHGVSPVSITMLNSIDKLISLNRGNVKILISSLYGVVSDKSKTSYLEKHKSFISNALSSDSDFLKYFTEAAVYFNEKEWTFQSFMHKDKTLNFIAVSCLRTILIIGLCIFTWLAAMTTTFELHNEEITKKDFYFFHGNISKSFSEFETKKTHIDQKSINVPEQKPKAPPHKIRKK